MRHLEASVQNKAPNPAEVPLYFLAQNARKYVKVVLSGEGADELFGGYPISNCTDDPVHTEDKRSLYGAHNFIIVSGKTTFGLFFDYPSKLTFDIGYDRADTLRVSCENADLDIYVLEGENEYDIVKQFRHVIGRSYIPP